MDDYKFQIGDYVINEAGTGFKIMGRCKLEGIVFSAYEGDGFMPDGKYYSVRNCFTRLFDLIPEDDLEPLDCNYVCVYDNEADGKIGTELMLMQEIFLSHGGRLKFDTSEGAMNFGIMYCSRGYNCEAKVIIRGDIEEPYPGGIYFDTDSELDYAMRLAKEAGINIYDLCYGITED